MRVIIVIAAIVGLCSADGAHHDGAHHDGAHQHEHHHEDHPAVPLAANLAHNKDKLMAIPSAPGPVIDTVSTYSQIPDSPAVVHGTTFFQPPPAAPPAPVHHHHQSAAAPVANHHQSAAAPVAHHHQSAAAPASQYSQPQAAPVSPTYQQNPTDQSNYYYYYPVEAAPEEKSFWNKMMDKLAINKMMDTVSGWLYPTERTDLGSFSDPITIILITAAVVVAASFLVGTTVTLASFTGLKATIIGYFDKLFKIEDGRDIEFNMDDMMFYVNRVYDAINKKY